MPGRARDQRLRGGVTVREKSGAERAVVVRAMVAVWLSLPEVPVKVTVADPAAALPAVKVIFCAVPGVNVSVAGFAVTPAGRPLSATAIGAENPFMALVSHVTGSPADPPINEAVVGETLREKSDALDGGCYCCRRSR